ncbi:MAG TPA: inositol monophosphatase family protein [Planktothrix sp.]|jgi:histidinol-phosphatase
MPDQLFDAFSRDLVFALDICEQASKLALHYYLNGVEAVEKEDGSPVTVADKKCERLIREAINSRYPDDAILGEEEGESEGATTSGGSTDVVQKSTKKRRWILDPIDGTYGFVRKIPVWALLLALEEDDDIIMGVISAPAVGDVYWAEKGRGAFKNGDRITVSKIDQMATAQFEFGGLNRIFDAGYREGFAKIVSRTYRQRGFGDYLGFAHVFEGKAEAHLEVGVKPWDLAPMKILAEEAGGKFSDMDGGSSLYKGSCLVSNGVLHTEFFDLLRSK